MKHKATPAPHIAFVTFGTPNFSQSRARYRRSLRRFGFTRIFDFELGSEPVAKARADNPEIFSAQRGYGYWLWKPYVIEAAMDAVEPGGHVFYTDIALEMVGAPDRLLDLAGGHDVVVFRVGDGIAQRFYTKRDAFILMNADSPAYWDEEMVCGTYLLLRNTAAARSFIAHWRESMRDGRILMDAPSTHGSELPEFLAHRHDQSVLSILAARERLPILYDPSQWGRDSAGRAAPKPGSPRLVATDFGQVFDLHRERNRSPIRRVGRLLKPYLPERLVRWARR